MSNGLEILSLAEALAAYSQTRQRIVAQNVANADTPGFKARDLTPFSETYAARRAADDGGAFRPAATRPGHVMADDDGGGGARAVYASLTGADSPNGNTVALEDQMIRGAEAKMSHDLALGVWRKSLDILRASIAAPGR